MRKLKEPMSYQRDGQDYMMYQQLVDITKGFFAKTGNLKAATKSAQALLRQKWGVTRINNVKEIAPYPVERFYGNNTITVEVLRKKIEKQIDILNKTYKVKLSPNLVELKADEQTYREIANNEKPSYRMYFKNELEDYDDNIKGNVIRLGAEDFEDEKVKKANGTQETEGVEKQLNDIKETVENGRKMSAMSRYVEAYVQQQGEVKK
jgi:hypothetical protein